MPGRDPHNTEIYRLLILARDTHALWQARTAISRDQQAATQAEHGVLELLVRDGAQTVPAIARARLVSRQHIQKLVDDLAARRLVEFSPNPAHKTSPLVDATIAGERAYTVAAAREAEILNAIAPDLARENLGPAIVSLRALADALRAAG